MMFGEVVSKLEKEGFLKKIKGEVAETIGYGEIINEEKTEKIEGTLSLIQPS